ncbi:hypothetical protein E5161_08600 [Cohnella pontilimi]|uniref:D-isomer specific 2-hydroxyacid dehydrogenase NAD-binding domain-containing protein n=1 Tax=Cohnella pontilimi TaxID=2564100 RepID=A0A4U0FDH9_9BACL|nr:hypothetical protein [Cohnella pontilimi]TJY42885.1 hypothetical protein E5161_08600 [Cohnella pontilimi]
MAKFRVVVLEQEPMAPDHPFREMEQVILTPHTAWYSEQSERELKRKVAQNASDVLTGYYPLYLVNPAVQRVVDLKVKQTEQSL